GAAVLPDDGPAQGFAGPGIPHQRGLTLVGDTDRQEPGRLHPAAAEDLAHRGGDALPYLLRLVLDPARTGIVLGDLPDRLGHDAHAAVDQEGLGLRRALIDRQDVTGRRLFVLLHGLGVKRSTRMKRDLPSGAIRLKTRGKPRSRSNSPRSVDRA